MNKTAALWGEIGAVQESYSSDAPKTLVVSHVPKWGRGQSGVLFKDWAYTQRVELAPNLSCGWRIHGWVLLWSCKLWAWSSSLLTGRVGVWVSVPRLRQTSEFWLNALTTHRRLLFFLRKLCRHPRLYSLAGTTEEIICGLDLKMIWYRPSDSRPSYTTNRQ